MSNRYLGITALSGLLLLAAIAGGRADDATLLPNAIQYFMDANGKPLANGKVFMYTPLTTTPKTTWTTASKAVAQPQPFIPLGISGKPASPIYGEGSYRQLVKDAAGNTIWDFNTASTGSGSTPSGTTVGDGIAVATVMPFDGLVAPANYMFAYGQAISRTTYSALLSAITLTDSVVCTAGTNIISNFNSTGQLAVTMPVESPCLPPGTTITAVPTATTVGVSNNATVSGVYTIQVFPSGRGDGSTTFNLPDLRGRTLAGRDNMGGTPAGRLTATYFGFSGTGLAQSGGNESGTLLATNLPPYTPVGTITNGAITSIFTGTAGQAALTATGGAQAFAGGSFASQQVTGTVASSQAASSFTGTATSGASVPFSRVQATTTTNWIIKVFPDSLSSDATWQVPLNSVPIGRGTGTGFDSPINNVSTTPKFLQQSGDGVTATAPLWGTVRQFITTATISGLRGLTAGSSDTVYVEGYYAANDGANRTFLWDGSSAAADNGCTIIQPNSLPATGRWLQQVDGTEFNVRWCGAKGDGVTVDNTAISTTLALAVAIKGAVYFPSTSANYLLTSAIVIPDGTHGLRLFGDARGSSSSSGQGAVLNSTAASTIDMTGVASGGTGSISDIRIENLSLGASGISGKALKIWNVNNIILKNVLVSGTQGNAIDMAGTAHFSFDSVTMTANGGCPFFSAQSAVGAQNIGPGLIDNSTVSITNDSFSSVCITGDPLGVEFRNLDIGWVNSTAAAAVDLNGPAPSAFSGNGSLSFALSHSESTYNTTSTGKTFRVGNVNPFGTLIIGGGNYWGQGNNTNYQQDWLQVIGARNIIVDGVTTSKLASVNGYSRSMVRFETGFTGTYSIRNPIADISGSIYSDANGKCSGTGSCWGGGLILDTLALGTPLPATSGGTGKAVYAIGDLLYADATTTLARLADVATTNALISGGIGVAPLWGKIGNSTLTNSSTTVNGQTCTLGSTCTVTAAATAVTVGTTTVGGGATTRILYDNAGVLGEYTISGSGTVVAMATGPSISGPTFTSTVTATGLIKNADLATMVTNTVKGNATSGTASPTDLAMTSCSTAASAVIWTTNTGFGCNTSITANTATSATTATTATNATNGATVATSTSASFFPLFAASSTNSNQPFNLDTTFTYNPSTDTLTATNFAGNATTATTATSATSATTATNATNATNTGITDDTSTNALMYPTWVTAATGNLPQKVSSTLLSWNPSTNQMKIGAGSDAPTSTGASLYITNNGTSSFVVRDSTNDVEATMLAASFGVIMGTVTSSPLLIRTNNSARLSISGAGVFTFDTIPAADTATTDNTLCVSTTGVILKGSGASGVCLGTSSARYKQDIISMGAGLAELVRLSPKNFFYKKGFGDDGARLQYGFIAEDVVKVLPGVTAPDKQGKPNSVDMVAMIPVMVNAIKQLKADNDNLRMDVLALQAKVAGGKK